MVYNTHLATVPGVYVWTGKRWIPIGETVQEEDQILFTINTTNGIYDIPTSGRLNNSNHEYDWYVTVDGQPAVTAEITDGHFQGTGTNNFGIHLTGLPAGKHKIRIIPHGDEVAGWGNAFGHSTGSGGANATDNKQKLISIDAPLSTLAFAPKTTETDGATSAAYMFANLFYRCTNLTTPAVIRDNYKLPTTITDLSNFLAGTHYNNDSLKQPIDLTPLKDWFTNNTTITNLSNFLYSTHNGNDSLKQPIDLTPLKDWFTNNQTIMYMSAFLSNTHFDNASLTDPINLMPLKNWFPDNRMMASLSSFLSNTHCINTSLTLSSDQPIFPNWVQTINQLGTTGTLQNVSNTFFQTFFLKDAQDGDTEPTFEDGTPLSNLGNPGTIRGTYTGRTGITDTNIGSNWKLPPLANDQ
jgi:hypothetical protein